MARKKKSARPTKGKTLELDKAKAIIRASVRSGAQRSKVVQGAVNRAGISTRTYRTARKQMRTVAIRRSRRNRQRGSGVWYVGLS